MCMKVDLPEPEGPVTARNSPASTSRLTPRRALHLDVAHPVDAGQVANGDDWHISSDGQLWAAGVCGPPRDGPLGK